MRKKTTIVPILLAAGSSERLGFPKPLARFGAKTALEIALENCAGLEPPVVVLGCDAAAVRRTLPRGVRAVFNRHWRSGQLSSLLCGLRRVPRGAAFLLYPVDQPLLTRRLVRRLIQTFHFRRPGQEIVMPRWGRHPGHPVIVSDALRGEFRKARTAREVIYWDPARVRTVSVQTPAVCRDFATPETYRVCLRKFQRRR